MKIKTIAAHNFAGSDFKHDLAPVTIIAGKNYSGKTKIPTAIRLALSGSLPPPIGTKGVYRLAGNPDAAGSMSVAIETDTGRKVALKWTRDAKGKVSFEGGIPSDLVMPEILSDPKGFWSKTSAERIQTIFEACPGAGKDLDKNISKRLGEIAVGPLKLRETFLEEIRAGIKDLFTTAKVKPQLAAARLIDWLKVSAKDAADSGKVATAALSAMGPALEKPADVTAELEKAQQDLARLQIGFDKTQVDTNEALADVTRKIEAYSRKYQQTPVEHLMDFINNELQTVAKDLRGLTPPPPIGDIQEELEAAHDAKFDAQAAITVHKGAVLKLEKDLGDLQIADVCPICRAKATGWKDRAVAATTSDLKVTQDGLARAIAARERADAEITRLTACAEATLKARSEYDQRKAELMAADEQLETDRDNLGPLLTERARLKTVLAETQEADEEAPAKVADLQTRIQLLRQQQAVLSTYEQDRSKRIELEERAATATAKAGIFKAAVKLAVEEQTKVSETAFNTVLKTARAFTDGLLNSPLEFIDGDLGRSVAEADTKRPGFVATVGSWITHETFSDSEQRIAYSAFAVALAAEASVKIVIIDEMATLEPERKTAFVQRLIDLVKAGTIDQAICLEPVAADYQKFAAKGQVKIINL